MFNESIPCKYCIWGRIIIPLVLILHVNIYLIINPFDTLFEKPLETQSWGYP